MEKAYSWDESALFPTTLQSSALNLNLMGTPEGRGCAWQKLIVFPYPSVRVTLSRLHWYLKFGEEKLSQNEENYSGEQQFSKEIKYQVHSKSRM